MKKLQLLAFALWIALTLPTAYAQNLSQQHLPEGAKMRLGKGETWAFQLSPDGTRLKVASGLGIWHYDTQTGQEVTVVPWSKNISIGRAVFSPDGRVLASIHYGRTEVQLWDVATGALLKTLTGHTGRDLASITFSPDGTTLASGSYDKTVSLWDVATGALLKTLTGHTYPVFGVTFSPDGRILASSGGGYDRTVRLWDVETGALLKTLIGHTRGVFDVSFSPDGRILASGSEDSTVRLWDVATGALFKTLTEHTGKVSGVAFSPDGTTLASSGASSGAWTDSTVQLWDVATGALLKTLTEHTGKVGRVAFSPDGTTLVGLGSTVQLWDVATGALLKTLTEHTGAVRRVAFSPDGRTLASALWDGTVCLWDVGTGALLKTLTGHTGNVFSVAFSPDGQMLASGSLEEIRFWDVGTGALLKTLTEPTGNVLSVAFSPDGQMLASGGNDTVIRLWDTRTGALRKTFMGHTATVMSMAFSPDGTTLGSTGLDNTVRLWDVRTGIPRERLTEPKVIPCAYGQSVVFSPDGTTFANNVNGGAVQLWDVHSGELQRTFNASAGTPPAFSPDSGFLAIGNHSDRVLLMDLAIGEAWEPLGYHTGVNDLAFSPDGRTLASGGNTGTILLWDATPYTSQPFTVETDSITVVPEVPVGGDVASVSLSPAAVWSGTIGDQVTVNANIAKGVDVRGYQVELTFETTALRFVSSVDAGYLPTGAFQVLPVVNNNRVTFGATSLQESSEGEGTLAAFTFEVLAASPAMPRLVDVKLTDSDANFLAVRIETPGVPDSAPLTGDVNGDGVINLEDMEAATTRLGQRGENTADMNGDGVVDAADLVLIAAAIEAATAAPSLHPSVVTELFTATAVRQWLSLARAQGLTGGEYQRGFLLLEQLLLILTPKETMLLANYPNPFNPETWIPYHLSEPADVRISIYAADGRLVRMLTVGHQGAGIYESRGRAAYWDGRNALGETVASGVYFYTFTTGEFTATRKLLIRK